MPTFKYKAQDNRQRLVSHTISAVDEREAEALLKDQGLKPLVLHKEKDSSWPLQRSHFPLQEKISLCRYLAVMINAGMTIGEAFDLLVKNATNKTVARVLQEVSSSVQKGQSLFTSFARYPEHFGEVFLAMIRVGELSGTLTNSLAYLAKEYEQENTLRKKITGALIYPLVIIGLMFAVGLLMITFVLPRLGQVFLKLNLELPLPTKLLLQISLFFGKNTLPVLVSLILGSIGFFLFLKSLPGQRMLTQTLRRLPLIKAVAFQYTLVRFTQSLSSLLAAGVPIGDALDIAGKALYLSSPMVAKGFSDQISKGVSLSTIFAEARIFPPLMVQMLAVGEKAGNLEKILAELAAFYQEEIENSLKNLVALLEPLLMIVVGLAVGLMVLAFISPIYSLIGKLQPQ